jgi:CubicO group peptidase (beta-lactamase class C family)
MTVTPTGTRTAPIVRRIAGLPRPTLLTGLAVAALAVLLALRLAPGPATLRAPVTGDQALAGELRAAAGADGRLGLQVALIDGAGVRSAGMGTTGGRTDDAVTADTPFEIGSTAKALTGMLLADMVADRQVRLETTLRELYPDVRFADPDVAAITLGELASHRAGLPAVAPAGPANVLHALHGTWTGANPYPPGDAGDLLAAAARARVERTGDYAYSNFGASLLGHALAHRAGTTYPALLRQRILGPLGMTATVVQAAGTAPPSGWARPHRASGHQVATWEHGGYAPAGSGVWSTSRDLARLLGAVRDGTAPGADAARSRWPTDRRDHRVGLGWHVSDHDGQAVTWHNGGTGGSSSFAGLAGDRGVVLLGNTDRKVDAAALRLLGVTAPDDAEVSPRQYPMLLVTVLVPPFAALTLLGRAARRRLAGFAPAPDRVGLLSAVVGGALVLLLTWRAGLWEVVPPLLWAASTALYLVGCVLALGRWRALPVVSGRSPWRRWGSLAGSCALTVAYVAVLGATLSRLD